MAAGSDEAHRLLTKVKQEAELDDERHIIDHVDASDNLSSTYNYTCTETLTRRFAI